MSTPTTTVRLSVQTRDRLARQAQRRGTSIAALLTELAAQVEREAFFEAERRATVADLADPAARAEYRAWDVTAGDGIA